MKLYLSVIGFSMLTISALNIIFIELPWYYTVITVLLCTVFDFAADGLVALVINKLPNRWFGVDNPLYHVTKTEREFYKRLNVRLWKDKVWDLGGIGGFSKKRLMKPNSPEYIERFIIECNKGVLTHRLSYPLGFLIMLIPGETAALTIALPVGIVNLFLNILPTIALRYNTPVLKNVLKRLRRRQAARAQI